MTLFNFLFTVLSEESAPSGRADGLSSCVPVEASGKAERTVDLLASPSDPLVYSSVNCKP
jgi:hypothetical protein